MAICVFCNNEMRKGTSCNIEALQELRPLLKDGVIHDPIPWGKDVRWNEVALSGKAPGKRPFPPLECCRDCGVARWGYHHPGCVCEECPICGGQLLSCGCWDHLADDEFDEDDDPEEEA